MNIEGIIRSTPLSGCFKTGLRAVKEDCVKFSNPRDLNGSVDVDSCLKSKYPKSNRWDYLIGYRNHAYFVEVHPAYTSEVETMIKKLEWMKDWVENNAVDLKPITKGFYWATTGKIAIKKGSPQEKKLAASGLMLFKKISIK